ncbi:zinc finger protein 2-like [Salvia hispanica]|uniref:zinc finger protein 2-like n=1 Tax=Salvia hispanica TaxID=49212 RepID=UPI0020098D98|nr:zinc finger protein 2-like [Salvia hispanica]
METVEPSYQTEASDVSVTSDKPLMLSTRSNTLDATMCMLNAPCGVVGLRLMSVDEILKILNNRESNEEGSLQQPSSLELRTLACKHCSRKFSTLQALGGHQNAHKQQRAWVKHRRDMVDMTGGAPPPPCGYPYYPYPTNRCLLGVRSKSKIQKPYSNLGGFLSLGGYHNPIIIDDGVTSKAKDGESSGGDQWLGLRVGDGGGDQHDASGIDLELRL